MSSDGWTTPEKSFDATDLDSFTHISGAAIDFDRVLTDHAVQTTVDAAGANWFVALEGSMDGVNWFDLNVVAVGPTTTVALAVVLDKPARYLRTYGDNRSTGTTTTVTTWVVSR